MPLRLKTCLFTFSLCAALLSACGGGGGNIAPVEAAVDISAPSLNFEPALLEVSSGETGTSVFSVTDNIGIRTGPDITCTEGGAYSGDTFTAPSVTVETISTCTATATDPSGNTGTATLTVTISPPNQSPTAEAAASKSIVSEGQPFILDASSSSDPEGAALAYSWTQIGGPAAELSGTTGPIIEVTAPLLTSDATLEFEVTVTDGEDESRQLVSIDVEALDTLTIAGWAPPNTGGVFTAQIAGITAPAEGGFRTHLGTNGFFSGGTESQHFDEKMMPLGLPSRATIRAMTTPEVGRLTHSVQSGERVYYIYQSFSYPRNEPERPGFTILPDRPEGELGSFGALIADGPRDGAFPIRLTASAYSDERLISAVWISGQDQPVQIDSFIHSPDGSQIRIPIVDATTDYVGEPALTQTSSSAYLVVWSQGTTDPVVTPLLGRQITGDGTQSGNVFTISNPLGVSAFPSMTTLSDGRILVVWNEAFEYPLSERRAIQGRILGPGGTFETDILTLHTMESEDDLLGDISVKAMKDGQALVTWWSQDRDTINGASRVQAVQIQALAIDATGAHVSNIFDIYTDQLELDAVSFSPIDDMRVAISTENRAVVGWNFLSSDSIEESYYSDFYPVGR